MAENKAGVPMAAVPEAQVTTKKEMSITPTKWELFLVQKPRCACCTFFVISLIMAMITMRLLASGVLTFDANGVWDVRGDVIVDRRDAFNQANLNSGNKLLCDEGGGPPKPCEGDGPTVTYPVRSQSMSEITVYYESTEDSGENMLSPDNLKYIKEFEAEILKLEAYKGKCQLACSNQFTMASGVFDGQCAEEKKCAAILSIVNYAFMNGRAQADGMASCYVDVPYCSAGDANVRCMTGQSVPCTSAAAFRVPNCSDATYGTSPCRSNIQIEPSASAVSFDALCTPEAVETDSVAVRTIAAAWKGERTKMLPSAYKCEAGGKIAASKLVKSSISLGAPLIGFTTDKKKEECSSEECIAKWGGKKGNGQYRTQDEVYTDWIVKDLWADVTKAADKVSSDSDGKVKIYAGNSMAMGQMFLQIMQNDGTLAVGSLLFVFFWIWTATGSLFLAACGTYECFISLFQAMLTWAIFGKYLGFLCVMMIFVILGIGADDIFVFLDAYKQSAYQDPSISGTLETRFVWAYRRAASAMFVTTATTAVCFLAAGFSQIPTVSAFGFFGCFVVIWDYLMVVSFFAAATVIYSQYCEGSEATVKGGHMCIECQCCCLRLCLPPTGEGGSRLSGWKAYKRLIGCDSCLVFFGIVIMVVGAVRTMPFLPLLGTVLLCIAAILAQAILNAPEDRSKARMIEVFFATTFFEWLKKHSRKLLVVWAVLLVASVAVIAVMLKTADQAPSFLREEHPLMKFISSGSQFGGGGEGRYPVQFVIGIDGTEPLDRSGIDMQTPSNGDIPLGKVKFSSAGSAAVATPAGQQAVLDFCRALEAAPDDLVGNDADCTKDFHAMTNPTMRLPTLGGQVGHCMTGVYCFMDSVKDYLEAHCNPCKNMAVQKGCNPDPNFTPCKNADETLTTAAWPAPDLHHILKSADFKAYEASLTTIRHNASHGHDNRIAPSMTGYTYADSGDWFAFIGINTSSNIGRIPYGKKVEFFDKYTELSKQMIAIPDAFVTSEAFVWMTTEGALYSNTYQSFIVAIIFCWIVLILTTWNFFLGTLGFVSVTAICGIFMALVLIFGWTLGIIEAIAIIIIVGLSVDYSIHLVHAYGEASAEFTSREEKCQSALSTMGISLVGGMATTSGAALFLFFCNITFFARFGQALFITVIISMLMALTFLMPMLMVVGPEGNKGYLPRLPCCKSKANEVSSADP